jgi:PEP-CTERM motif
MKSRHTPLKKTALALAVMTLAAGAPAEHAWAAGCSLAGATSWSLAANADWTTASAWNPAVVPNSSGTNVCITNGTGVVTLSTTQAVGSLQVASGNGLNITSGNLVFGGSTFQNDGLVTNAGYIELGSNVTLSGAGTLTLAGGQIGTNGNAVGLTNQSTINGFGVIGSNAGPVFQNLGFSNSGTVNANSSGNVLSIQGNGGTITNSGTFEATSGGVLNLAPSGAIVNSGGTINANGGTVNISLSGQQMVQGGTLTSANGGVLQTVGSAGLDGLTHGAITLSSGSTYVAGAAGTGTTTFSTGTLNLAAGSTLALGGALDLVGDTTLAGAGVVTMNAGQIGTNDNAATLTNNLTIQGSGVIGSNATTFQNLGVVNSGLINANVSGQTLSIQGNGSTFVNSGTLKATNGATLNLNTQAALVNAGGSLAANGTGSVVNLTNQTILGGTLATTGGGVMQTIGSATLDGSTAANGAITFANGSTYTAGVANSGTPTYVAGTLNLGTGAGATIALGGALDLIKDTSLNGSGGVVTMDGGQIGTNGNGVMLTNNVTIHGSGVIGSNATTFQNLGLTNNGTINADASGKTLSIQGNGSPIVNAGLFEATNGGTLALNTAQALNNAAGSIVANGSGNTVNLINQTVMGGTLTATNGAVMQTSGSATLDGTTLGAITLSNGSTYLAGAAGSGTPTFVTGLLNLGTGGGANIALGGALELLGNTTVSGTGGVVTMNAGQIGTDDHDYALTNNVTIQGSGLIGSNNTTFQNLSLANNGVINANVSGQTLSIQGNGSSIVNSSLIEATNGGTLNLQTTTALNNSAGSVVAHGAGSTVNLSNQTVQGGILATSSGGVMQTVNSARLDGATLGAITLSDGSTYTAGTGTVTGITGALNLGTNTGSTLALAGQLQLVGDVTISGPGAVTLAGGEIGTNGNNFTLNNQAIVQGQGLIGSNNGALFQNLSINNSGTILANSAGNTLTVGGTGALTGTGTLQTAGGTLNLAIAGPSTQGKLVMGGAGSALNLNTQNLTITSDYTNAQSGIGNSFDRRAGVSGTGLILAGGNAAQAITGNGVSNGGTSDATLTIGNVRVGANTLNYAVANTGSTGPALRGAIQTSANGGNISDARLSGSGVTASNYSTGGPGSSTGNLGVVFTTATAGALAPLVGQVVNLTSNFDNIGDQKLHIVVGAGAAAYTAAAGNASSPVQVANQRIGGSNSAAVAVSNTIPTSAYSEDLNASVGATTGAVSASGSIAGRVAGTSNTGTGAINVSVDTSSAGAKTGGVTLAYQTAGAVNGVSNGLGTASVGTQVVTVSGNVYQAAAGALQSAPLNFGTVQVGQAVSQNLVVRNTATGAAGFVEDLNASFGASNGTGASLISGSGGLSGIVAGSNSSAANGVMTVSVNTSAAGVVNGGIAVNYATAGAVGGVSNGLGTASVGSQNYGVAGTIQATANVVNQASPLLNTPSINLGAVRVGATSPTALVSLTNQGTASPQAALNASIASNGAPVTAGGSVNLLAPGATSANQLSVGLNTATAGNFTGANAGSATLTLVSDASNIGNCAPNCQMNLASQQVSVSGKVYAPAVAQVNSTVVDFGIVHTGDVVATQGISVTNAANTVALNDTLRGSIGGATGAFTASGSLAGVAAQATDTTSFQAGLNTGSSGVFTGTATASFASHDADLADLALGSTTVTLKGQVDNYAQASLAQTAGAGTLSKVGNTYTLDLGDLTLGGASLTDTLSVLNSATGLADLLGGSFSISMSDPNFHLSGFDSFSGVAAGGSFGGLTVSFDGTTLGAFDETLVLHANGSNASGYDAALADTTLVLHGDITAVAAVPEPGTYLLMLSGLLAIGQVVRRRVARRHD